MTVKSKMACLQPFLVNTYLDKISVPVEGDMLFNVAAISCNNDKVLGDFIAHAFVKSAKTVLY